MAQLFLITPALMLIRFPPALVLAILWMPLADLRAFAEPKDRAQQSDAKDKPRPAPAPTKPDDAIAPKFCAAIAPAVQEARIAWQMKRLNDLDAQMRQRLEELGRIELSAKNWVERREQMLKAAKDEVVAIYAKMQPETAATQIAAMDDAVAAAILSKLKPGVSGAILDQMDAARAAKLSGLIAGGMNDEKKS